MPRSICACMVLFAILPVNMRSTSLYSSTGSQFTTEWLESQLPTIHCG